MRAATFTESVRLRWIKCHLTLRQDSPYALNVCVCVLTHAAEGGGSVKHSWWDPNQQPCSTLLLLLINTEARVRCTRVYVPCTCVWACPRDVFYGGWEYVRCLSSSAPEEHPGPLAHAVQDVKFLHPLWLHPVGPVSICSSSCFMLLLYSCCNA